MGMTILVILNVDVAYNFKIFKTEFNNCN
jgi:hypothetical protein